MSRKSYIAEEIDKEYRREQIYKKRKRQPCKTRECEKCKFFKICTERNEIFLNDIVDNFIKDMREEQNSIK